MAEQNSQGGTAPKKGAVKSGDWLIEQMNSKGGRDSEYSDIVFGTVNSVSPLLIQYSDTMILTEDFLTLGRRVQKYKLKVKYKDKTDTSDGYREEEVTVDGTLKAGDAVVMLRRDGGQSFYILDKVAEEV